MNNEGKDQTMLVTFETHSHRCLLGRIDNQGPSSILLENVTDILEKDIVEVCQLCWNTRNICICDVLPALLRLLGSQRSLRLGSCITYLGFRIQATHTSAGSLTVGLGFPGGCPPLRLGVHKVLAIMLPRGGSSHSKAGFHQ
jgi:hypothetical protein